MDRQGANEEKRALAPYLSAAAAWAFAIGTSIGWGSFVVTCNTYLLQAGPLGSVLGMLVGMVVMLAVARSYHYLMNRYPDAGGAYSFAKNIFGSDYGFLMAWFLGLTYAAIFWANATSLPLFARYFIGDAFHTGYLYTCLGYDVYAGEIVLTVAAIAIVGAICMRARKALARGMVALAALFACAIVACFLGIVPGVDEAARGFEPLVLPDSSVLHQVVLIACVSPWAFIGFESISHSVEEFSFARSRTFRVLASAVVATTALYILVTLLSVTAFPPQYANWQAYISDLGNLQGIEALPAFYAAYHYLGQAGVAALVLALLALVLTSLVGNTVALSRLLYAVAKDGLLPRKMAQLNRHSIPQNAVGAIVAVSVVIPFLGRTAIGWIVDVTTIGAMIVYGFASAAAFKEARQESSRVQMATGAVGVAAMVVVGLVLLLPSLFGSGSMAPESYILFSFWAVLGFILFRVVLQRDPGKRFGKSVVVWVALLSLVLLTSVAWLNQAEEAATEQGIVAIRDYYDQAGPDGRGGADEEAFIADVKDQMRAAKSGDTLLVVALLAVAFGVMLSNFSYLSKREQESERKLGAARSAALTDALTGIKNKMAYTTWEQDLDEAISAGAAEGFSVVVCDVNGLKYVNDTFGHKAGDEYIRSACMTICTHFRHSPVFRIGGDEFVAILKGEDYQNRVALMEDFDRKIMENLAGGAVVVSAGCSDYRPGEDLNVHDVFERADGRMYERKRYLKECGAKTRD